MTRPGGKRARVFRAVAVPALTILTLTPSPALASTPGPRPTPGAARIVTNFVLDGRVTVADNIRGEHVGQRVTRIWTFTPTCATGACQTIKLVRTRAAGTDRVTLRRRAPGYYVGSGSFFAPLRCGSSTYAKGAAVPFTITVRVTAVTLFGSAVVATEISATYTNSSRTNLTPCVAALGHDAARYRGHLMRAPGGGGSQGLSARSPEGS